MSSPVLLDTGPLVAFIDGSDDYHKRAIRLFDSVQPPFLTCEAVLGEAIFLLERKKQGMGHAFLSMGEDKIYEIGIELQKNLGSVKNLLIKYKNLPISLADACLIRCAEIYHTDQIATFDSDFEIYRWGRNRKFKLMR